MDIGQAALEMRALIQEHGLAAAGWTFEWDRAVKRVGACHYGTKRLTLSKSLVAINPEAEIRNTMLHEVAHALAGGRAGHGPAWQRIHRALGGNASRVAHVAARPELRWLTVCPTPGCDTSTPRARRTNTAYACRACCNRHAGGRFDPRFRLVWKPNPAFKG